jgi:site-specific DNA-methyltransferase (adenine-specific)
MTNRSALKLMEEKNSFDMESNVYNIDCMEAMREMKDNQFELAIVDIPYGIGADKPSIKPCKIKQKNGSYLNITQPNYKHKAWDKLPEKEYFAELKRVSKNQIIWGVNYVNNFDLSGGRIVWDKLNATSDQFDCEIAYWSGNNRTDIVYYMWSGMFHGVYIGKEIHKALRQRGDKKKNEKRIHPTHKPVVLYKWLLKNYAKPGDNILDTHMGSQSSRIACHDMGFDFTGYEIDRDYFDAGNKRFEHHIMQGSLFEAKQMF